MHNFVVQSFLENKRKRLNNNLWNKTSHSSLEINYVFAARKPRSEPAVVVRLELPDFAELAFDDFVSWAGFLWFPFHFYLLASLLIKICNLVKFFSRKTKHFWGTSSTLFFICSVTFILPVLLLSHFLNFLFFVFYISLFWVFASVQRSLSSNLPIKSSRSCLFSESSSSFKPVPFPFLPFLEAVFQKCSAKMLLLEI